jgi:signal peptidase I
MAKDRDRRNWRAEGRPYIIAATVAIVMFILIVPAVVHGNQMVGTLEAGDVIIIDRETYSQNQGLPGYGDIVAFKRDYFENGGDTKNQYRLSRIIGLPGDTIEIKGDGVYRNDVRLGDEPYARGVTDSGEMDGPVTLQDDEVFILSDNRSGGADSRMKEIGPRELGDLRGKVVFRIWPLKKIGTVD